MDLILFCKNRYEKDVLLPIFTHSLRGLVRLDRLGSAPISRESGRQSRDKSFVSPKRIFNLFRKISISRLHPRLLPSADLTA